MARPAPIILADLGNGSCQSESRITPEPGKAARHGAEGIHVAIYRSFWYLTSPNAVLSIVPCNVI